MGVESVSELVDADAKQPLSGLSDTTKKERCISKIKIVWAFITFLISVADVLVIIYLSYLHFSHSSDLIAWLMLLPILLNFIGIFTFLSNENERREMEEIGCRRFRNLMFFPVVGPAFSTLRLFAYTLQTHKAEQAERLESLITKMKQYESFFRAAPEAFIQLTFRIITFTRDREFHAEDPWTTLCIFLCLFSLAESNMYGCIMPYYRMFEYSPTNAWSIEHIEIPWRIGIFFYTYFSIGSRIYADSVLKATACFYFKDTSFGEVIIFCFIGQFLLRAGLYALFNGLAGSSSRKGQLADEGVYGAFTYSWRSLFLSFDFQSYTKRIFLGFYLENAIMIGGSYIVIYGTRVAVDLDDRYFYHFCAVASGTAMLIAIGLRFSLRYHWTRKQNKIMAVKAQAQGSTSMSSEGSTKETV